MQRVMLKYMFNHTVMTASEGCILSKKKKKTWNNVAAVGKKG